MKKMIMFQLLVISINVYADNKYKVPSHDSLERLMTENYINNNCRFVGDENANLKDGIISDIVKNANNNPTGGTIETGINSCVYTAGVNFARFSTIISIGDVIDKKCREVKTSEYECAVTYKMYCKGKSESGKALTITPMTVICTNLDVVNHTASGVLLVNYNMERMKYELVKVVKSNNK